jgi:hypothetical protein
MQGVINVDEVMREQRRLNAFQETMAIRDEQMVLAMWWNLQRAMRDARTAKRRREVARDQREVTRLYGPELTRALRKHALAMSERDALARRAADRRTALRSFTEATGL